MSHHNQPSSMQFESRKQLTQEPLGMGQQNRTPACFYDSVVKFDDDVISRVSLSKY